jgi:hypothetical protein
MATLHDYGSLHACLHTFQASRNKYVSGRRVFQTKVEKKNETNHFYPVHFYVSFGVLNVKKTELMAGGIRCADHATPSIRKSWH